MADHHLISEILEVLDPDEYGQADDADREAWLDRSAVEREVHRRKGDAQ
jgi:hypothetical protein